MRIQTFFNKPAILSIFIVLFLSSCVSQKEWNELLERKNELISMLEFSDEDGDGIRDEFDHDPNTPKGARVDLFGRSLDSDEDGIIDEKDPEPYSPPGYSVNSDGVAQRAKGAYMIEDEFLEILDESLKNSQLSGASAGHDNLIGTNGPEYYTLHLPLPLASTSYPVPLSYFTKAKNYADINEVIQKELKIAGFDSDLRYFLVEDHVNKKSGYAIITPVEVIDADAVRQDWWSPNYDELQITSLRDLFSALLFMKVGYSRLMIILVTEAKIIDRLDKTKSIEQIRSELYSKYNNGLRRFTDLEIGSETICASLKCEILIYEFQKLQKENRVISIQPKVDAKKHLKGAKLDALLKH